MSFLTDRKYAGMVCVRLDGFKWERNNLGRAKCPYCEDSVKKRRFYIWQNNRQGANSDAMNCFCHNCNYSKSFGNFLKEFDAGIYGQYRLESFAERSAWRDFIDTKAQAPKEAAKPLFSAPAEARLAMRHPPRSIALAALSSDHPARVYVEGRGIEQLDLLYYSEDFQKTVAEFRPELKDKAGSEPRIIIPFFDEHGNLQTMQGRSMDPNVAQSQRYLTFKIDDSSSKIYGLERVNKASTVSVVEGPFDSLFVPNCVATADANLLNVEWGDLYIPDNQYRNEQVCNLIDKIIDAGKRVVLFPASVQWKDLNDMVVKGGISKKQLLQLIAANAYSGLRAKMVFAGLRKA